jgi:hypothetical protein
MTKLEVGQKLWFVPNERRGKPYETTVTKVGKKWASIGYRIRIDIETMWADGGKYSSPGRCYFSEQEYLVEMSLFNKWQEFKIKLDRLFYPPKGIDESVIDHMINMLRLDE